MRRLFFMVAVSVVLFGCGTDSVEEEHVVEYSEDENNVPTQFEDEDHDSGTGEISFSEEQKKNIEFAVEPVSVGPFGQAIKSTGQILPVPGGLETLVAPASGLLFYSDLNTVDGVMAIPGQPLFYIEGGSMPENNIDILYGQAENEYLRAKAEYERKVALIVDKIVSERELLLAKTEYMDASAVLDNLKKSYSSGRFAVSPGVSGYIQHIEVDNGQFVEAGEAIATVVSNDLLYIRAEVPSRFIASLDGITTANFRSLNTTNSYSLEDLEGRLVAYGRSVDNDNPLVPVTFLVENPGELVPGTFMEVYITTVSSHEAITVPNSSIIEEMGAYFVFVEVHDDTYSKIPVSLGHSDGFHTEVLSGLSGQEMIVSKGAIFIKLAQGTGTLDSHAGHVH